MKLPSSCAKALRLEKPEKICLHLGCNASPVWAVSPLSFRATHPFATCRQLSSYPQVACPLMAQLKVLRPREGWDLSRSHSQAPWSPTPAGATAPSSTMLSLRPVLPEGEQTEGVWRVMCGAASIFLSVKWGQEPLGTSRKTLEIVAGGQPGPSQGLRVARQVCAGQV
jgi:hypothetical protein